MSITMSMRRERVMEILRRGWGREPTEAEIAVGMVQFHLGVTVDGRPGPRTAAARAEHPNCRYCPDVVGE